MTSIQQRAELQRRIWQIANDVRGAVDGWDFKQYVLGTLFYRFISENFASYIEGGDDSIHYAELADNVITPEIKDDAIKTKGYFIYPSQLFVKVAASANINESLNTDLATIFAAIETSANGYPSERDIKGLFADFDTTSNRLGNTVKDKNSRLAAVLKGVAELDFGHFDASHIDLFGDAYEFLISNYAANAGKSGGEFFTPQHVSKLIAQLAMHKQSSVNKIYDPACGSGSLLLQAKKHFDAHIIEDGFFGQELNHTTYNLARMNMFLHNVNYDKFNIQLGDTLIDPQFGDDKPFDAIVSNPPYSVKWRGSDDPTLINDDRFAPAGVLAPKSKADFAFVLHALSYLSNKGRAAIVCFPGIFYRSGAEQKIRQYLVDNNYVETVISLVSNLFYGTTIAVNILVLSKHKTDTTTQFIDASGLFKKEINNNVLLDMHVDQIMQVFDSKANVDYFAQSVPFEKLAANNYNLSVSSYVQTKDRREVVDIVQLNAKLKTTVAKIGQLRSDINEIVDEIEGRDANHASSKGFLERLLDGIPLKWMALSDVGIFARGRRFVKTDLISEGVPCIHYGEMYTHYGVWARKTKSFLDPALASKLRTAKKGDVIIVAAGETIEDIGNGTAWLGDEDVVIHDACFSFTSQLNPKYVSYILRTTQFKEQIKRDVSSGKISSINSAGLAKANIPVPCPDIPKKSLKIQAEIVRILDTFSELTAELTVELATELVTRKKQHKYYADFLLAFPRQSE